MARFYTSLIAFALIAGSGCGATQLRETLSLERSLTASGFQMRKADTPAKLAKLQGLPQRKILKQTHDGQILYLYADATDCKCLYAGTEKAYAHFQQSVAAGYEATELAEAKALQPASTDPDWVDTPAFGEWAPWY
ncbi:MAG: hypothetical protein WBG86_02090 [Polyangiales bacterium]